MQLLPCSCQCDPEMPGCSTGVSRCCHLGILPTPWSRECFPAGVPHCPASLLQIRLAEVLDNEQAIFEGKETEVRGALQKLSHVSSTCICYTYNYAA